MSSKIITCTCDVCNKELDGTMANFLIGVGKGQVEQLVVSHDMSAGKLLRRHTSAADGGFDDYCENNVNLLLQGIGTRQQLQWTSLRGDIRENINTINRLHPRQSKSVKKIISKLQKLSKKKASNIFRSLTAHTKEIRDGEMQAGIGENPPTLPDGSYRCYVLCEVPYTTRVEINYVFTLHIPGLARFDEGACNVDGTAATKIFATGEDTFLVGYDIEYQKLDASPTFNSRVEHERYELVSHQWWFNLAGVRFGVVFCTDLRISQKQFVELLDEVIPEAPAKAKKKRTAYVWSYFSVVESGWMFQSDKIPGSTPRRVVKDELVRKFHSKHELEPKERDVVFERDREWEGYTPVHERKANLFFADAINLQSGGLAGLGKTIGIEKLQHDHIEQMKQFRTDDLLGFAEYGIIDCVIAAEAALYFRYMTKQVMQVALGLDIDVMKTRITGYSAAVFERIFEEHFGKEWKLYFGYEKRGKRTVPTFIHEQFVKHYYGGRNDALAVGPRGTAYYHDLHSAYLTSVAMMGDYNFSAATVWSGEDAEKRLEELHNNGPYMPHGVTVSFQFKKSIERGGVQCRVFPIFPVRINDPEALPSVKDFANDGLLFPRGGSSSFSWPEFWVAKELGLLDKVIVHELVEFAPLTDETGQQTWKFSTTIQQLLKERAKNSDTAIKAYLKAILCLLYGKTAQGISDAADAIRSQDNKKRIGASKVSCYPLASYMTGFCRATVGELLQLNECYAITTDGFITPKPIDQLVHGKLSQGVSGKLKLYDNKGKPKDFISKEHEGERSLFTKTRGYMFLNNDVPTKIAAQGAQVRFDGKYSEESVELFLQQLQRGYGDKGYWPSLAEVRKLQSKDKEYVPYKMLRQDVKVDMTYDFKHLPVQPEIREMEYKGKQYPFVYFSTVPLESAMDFYALRMLANRRDPMSKYCDNFDHWRDHFNKLFAESGLEAEIKTPADLEHLIELHRESKELPPYMELEDYREMLDEFGKYRKKM